MRRARQGTPAPKREAISEVVGKPANRSVAFLRAINVGGHRVTMEELRRIFDGLGLVQVETFIASGNVLFDAPKRDHRRLEQTLERELLARLGYEVKTFLRTLAEVEAIVAATPFASTLVEHARAFSVGFLAAPLGAEARAALDSLSSEIDQFASIGREVYWLCTARQSDSTFSNNRFERIVGAPATFRGIATVRKLAAKYGRAAAG